MNVHDIWLMFPEQFSHHFLRRKAVYPGTEGTNSAESHMWYLGTTAREATDVMAHVGNQFDLALHNGLFAAEGAIFIMYNDDFHKYLCTAVASVIQTHS